MYYVCSICTSENNDIDEVYKLKCNHITCWRCLSEHVEDNLSLMIKCPVSDCVSYLRDAEIRKVLSPEIEDKYDQIMLNKVEFKVKCLLPECGNVFICSDSNVQFECAKCSLFNCVSCKKPHKYLTCDQSKSTDESPKICKEEIKNARKELKLRNSKRNREMLEEMESIDLFIHDTLLECPSCYRTLAKGDGVLLRCSHIFCRHCLREHIKMANKVPIRCPSRFCRQLIAEREIIALLDVEELQVYIDRCYARVKSRLDLFYQCQTPNCSYFVTYSVPPKEIKCPSCGAVNCIKCYLIHPGQTCDQYMKQIESTSIGRNLKSTEERIRNKELMRCLKCRQILQKIDGCSWIQCSNCSFEMCWALQIRRWGPKGRGDESDGCKCLGGSDGDYCAPNCGSCQPHITVSDSESADESELDSEPEFDISLQSETDSEIEFRFMS